ncbi:cationic amino acid transporter 4-like protein [Plakobranchus ocellatus]|uniref:Cationic amino acid transporter 4-like protein n=1 Tax=Plakobranchus ocellatus TaxID=259542 RepID=A0AAV3ZR89_9GAST|nr:cationic amino acid transporter 4-like protein [Plakobranchus ocellatus]
MAITLLLVAFLYVGTVVGLFFLVPFWLIDIRAPLPSAFAHRGLAWGKVIVTVAPLIGLSNLQLVAIYAVSRCIYRMSKDGLLFSFFLAVNKNSGTPLRAVLVTGVLTSLLALFCDISHQVRMVVVFRIFTYITVASALIKFKVTHGQYPTNSLPPMTILREEDSEPVPKTADRDIARQEQRNSNSLSKREGDLRHTFSEIDAEKLNSCNKTHSAFDRLSPTSNLNDRSAKNRSQSALSPNLMRNLVCEDNDEHLKQKYAEKSYCKDDAEICGSNKSKLTGTLSAFAGHNYGTLRTFSDPEKQIQVSMPNIFSHFSSPEPHIKQNVEDDLGSYSLQASSTGNSSACAARSRAVETHRSTDAGAEYTQESIVKDDAQRDGPRVSEAAHTHGSADIESVQTRRSSTKGTSQTYGSTSIETVETNGSRVASWLFPVVPGLIPVNVLIVLHVVTCVALAAQIFFCRVHLVTLQPGAVLGFIFLCTLVFTISFFLWALCASRPTRDTTKITFQTPFMPLVPTLSIILSATMMFIGVEKREIFEVFVVVVTAIIMYVTLTMCRYQRSRQKDGEKLTLTSYKSDIKQNGTTP